MSHSMGLGHFVYTYEGSFHGVCVLQCVAVRFAVLRSALQCVAVRRSALQCVAVRRSVLRTIFDGGRLGR